MHYIGSREPFEIQTYVKPPWALISRNLARDLTAAETNLTAPRKSLAVAKDTGSLPPPHCGHTGHGSASTPNVLHYISDTEALHGQSERPQHLHKEEHAHKITPPSTPVLSEPAEPFFFIKSITYMQAVIYVNKHPLNYRPESLLM